MRTPTSQLVLNLPDAEIVMSEETIGNDGLIRKVLHYRNGVIAILREDFDGYIYSISLSAEKEKVFRISRNALFQSKKK